MSGLKLANEQNTYKEKTKEGTGNKKLSEQEVVTLSLSITKEELEVIDDYIFRHNKLSGKKLSRSKLFREGAIKYIREK